MFVTTSWGGGCRYVMVEVREDTCTGQNDQRNVLNGVVVIVLAVNLENPGWNPAWNNVKF